MEVLTFLTIKIMKKKLLLLIATLIAMGQNAFAYNFSVVVQSGQTLYFNRLSSNTVKVTSKNPRSPYYYPTYPSGDLVIPSTVTHDGVTYNVTSIGDAAFRDCSGLTSVTIPNSVTSIGIYAFVDCSSLTSITIGGSVTSIGEATFADCSSLTSVTIPDGVTSIGEYAFYDCSSLTSVTIPDGVTTIGKFAFRGCSGLTSVTIPSSVTSIGEGAFAYCRGLTSVTIGGSVNSIGKGAFAYCSGLTSVTILDGVTSIGEDAFAYCSSLTSVTIGGSVTSIGNYAFYNCSSLTSITIYAEAPPTLGDNVFYGVPSYIDVNVPCGKQQLYHTSWTHFIIFIEMCNSGIDDVNALSANVYSVQGRIVVERGDGGPLGEVRVCDMMGRSLATGGVSAEGTNRYSFDVPATGTYCVKIGDFPARKVVVIR